MFISILKNLIFDKFALEILYTIPVNNMGINKRTHIVKTKKIIGCFQLHNYYRYNHIFYYTFPFDRENICEC